MIQSKTNEENGVGFNCDLCIAKGLMGVNKGRICLIHQIDFDNDSLEYNSKTSSGSVSGTIRSLNDFSRAISELLALHGDDRIELALKQINYNNQYGVCIKSFPQSQLSTRLLNTLFLCMGGFSGTELTQLPYNGTILDQPNIFIEAYNIWVGEYNKKVQEDRKEDKKIKK